VLRGKRVLIIAPGRLVREQIADEVASLATLRTTGAIADGVPAPARPQREEARHDAGSMGGQASHIQKVFGEPPSLRRNRLTRPEQASIFVRCELATCFPGAIQASMLSATTADTGRIVMAFVRAVIGFCAAALAATAESSAEDSFDRSKRPNLIVNFFAAAQAT
jgi:hypothetical protein